LTSQCSESTEPAHSNPSKPQDLLPSLEIIHYKPADQAQRQSHQKRAHQDTDPDEDQPVLSQVPFKDDKGSIQAVIITYGNRPKKRAVFTKRMREETALARKKGVCERCRKSKRKCDLAQQENPYLSCRLCSDSRVYKGAYRMPCSQATLWEMILFRTGPAKHEPLFTNRQAIFDLVDISNPDESDIKLTLTQHIGHHRLTVYVSEFTPTRGDVVDYKWTAGGKEGTMWMPRVALTNINKVGVHIRNYINSAKRSYLECLKTEDDLTWMTISTAMDYAQSHPRSLVDQALDLWAICRMIEIPWEMCGEETLGVARVEDESNPHFGRIPIPPNMDTQLDQVVIKAILNPLKEQVIGKLEERITPAKPEAWFETYLTAFILLSHVERLAKHSAFHARLHTMPGKYSNPKFLEGAFHTAKIILSRFHFVCNGSAPLRLNWDSPTAATMARLEPKQVQFMRQTQAMIQTREQDVLRLRKAHAYGADLYWCHQLFFENWDSSYPIVVEVA